MAIKGGDLLTVGDTVLIDRIQNAGPGQVNIPQEKIYELGNYQSVGTVLDIPDLSFPCESFDASAEMEALLLRSNFATDAAGTEYSLAAAKIIDVVQQFKPGVSAASPFDVVGSVAVPFLSVESVSYRYGLRESAGQTVTFKGDSIIYGPPGSSMYVQTAVGTNTANQEITLSHLAFKNMDDVIGGVRYALSVRLLSGKRLIKGTDYTEIVTGAGVTKTVKVNIIEALAATETVQIVFCSDIVASYPQVSHAAPSASRPAAIRGRNIQVFVGGVALSDRWNGVQSVEADYRVQLQRDEEFGNINVVGQDYDVPDVTGSITVKPRDYADLFDKIQEVTGAASATESIGALQQTPLPLDIVLYSPTDGSVLKTLYVEDAKFTVPGFSGRVQQKLEVQFSWVSDGGNLSVFKGARP